MISIEDGARAVRLARAALDDGVRSGDVPSAVRTAGSGALPPLFREARGVFVTLKRYPSGGLRGCIGFPLPVYPLQSAVPRAALAAAFEDPRFPPVRAPELGRLTVEVSILTVPEPIVAARPQDRVQRIRIGEDGLIVEGYGASGLLLPQVAVELDWDAETFLSETCEKAGLSSTAWMQGAVTIRRFQADVFAETVPGGSVLPVPLTPSERSA